MNRLCDSQLVESFKNGNLDSFNEIIERYTQKVRSLALRITRNTEDAEEIVQDVFLTVYRKIDKFEGKAAFSSWLFRVTANTSFMKLRKRKQTASIALEEISPNLRETLNQERSDLSDVHFLSLRHELREQIQLAVNKLPEEYRQIFIMRDVDGLTNQEVSDCLSVSLPAVKSRLHRARLMVKRWLESYYSDFAANGTTLQTGSSIPSAEVI